MWLRIMRLSVVNATDNLGNYLGNEDDLSEWPNVDEAGVRQHKVWLKW